jgi:regulator of replication initiation timing
MRIERILFVLLIAAAAAIAAINWMKVGRLQAENEQLRARIASSEAELSQGSKQAELAKAEAEKLRGQTSELLQLRNEVTQLRSASATAQSLSTENQRLRAENQQLRSRPGSAPAAAAAAPTVAARDQFPRASWNFAGYASPEAGLVSAIWAMKEGDPKTYLESLSPQEQQRMAPAWQNKSEAEIAEKHKADVSGIAGMRILERQNVSPNEVVMNVYLEGPGRVEKVRMNQVGQDWKFGGFVRNPQ